MEQRQQAMGTDLWMGCASGTQTTADTTMTLNPEPLNIDMGPTHASLRTAYCVCVGPCPRLQRQPRVRLVSIYSQAPYPLRMQPLFDLP